MSVLQSPCDHLWHDTTSVSEALPEIKPHSSIIYTDLNVRCICGLRLCWHYLDDEDTIQVFHCEAPSEWNQTLEEAARLADEEGATPASEGGTIARRDSCDNVARAIRALKRPAAPAAPQEASADKLKVDSWMMAAEKEIMADVNQQCSKLDTDKLVVFYSGPNNWAQIIAKHYVSASSLGQEATMSYREENGQVK